MNPMHLLLSAALALPGGAPSPTAPAAPTADPIPAARPAAADPIRVVATLPVYAEVARAVGGSAVTVEAIADPAEDAHFVRPKPSFALMIRRADLFITTGLDLELWVPALLDKAGNADVREGARGHVPVHTGIPLLDVPAAVDRSRGDIHVYGNPHLFTDPLNMVVVARNIAAGLKTVAPERAAEFDRNVERFAARIHTRLYGERLMEMLGGETLSLLDRQGRLMDFLEKTDFHDRKLVSFLGGWHATARAFRGRDLICYHKNWAYFEARFGVRCVEYVEAKPGIPPTPGHVGNLIDLMRNRGIDVLLAANYFDDARVRAVANRAGARAVIVPLQPGGAPGTDSYFDVVDRWVGGLAAAFGER